MTRHLTPKERSILELRLSRAICWSETSAYNRSEAIRLAKVVIDEMDQSMVTAATQRRAVTNIAERLEKTA